MSLQSQAHSFGEKRKFVYFLQDPVTGRVKIGHTRRPGARISSLASRHPTIDLANSALIETDTRALEYVLHGVFKYAHRPLAVYSDGGTEWFDAAVFEDAIAFAKSVGEVRGKDYPLIRDLTEMVQMHRSKSAERWAMDVRQTAVPAPLPRDASLYALADAAFERVMHCIDILGERGLECLVTDGLHWAIERVVDRDDEPEYWTDAWRAPHSWANRLWIASHVVGPDGPDYGRSFHGFIGTTFVRAGDNAREFVHLPNRWQQLAARGDQSAESRFFGHLQETLAGLKVRYVPIDADPFGVSPAAEQ